MNSSVIYTVGTDGKREAKVAEGTEKYKAQPGEIIIRNLAVAFNPSDGKYLNGAPRNTPLVLGSDVSGIVEEVGEGVTGFAPGDKVAGYTPFQYSHYTHLQYFYPGTAPALGFKILPQQRYGGFQHYVAAYPLGITKVPDNISTVEAATLGCAYATAALGIWVELGVPFPAFSNPTERDKRSILIWGASGAVGSFAVQIAKLSGLRVIATASEKNRAYVESLGADVVYDYNAADVVASLTLEGVVDVYDTIGSKETLTQIRDMLGVSNGQVASTSRTPLQFHAGITRHSVWVPGIFDPKYKEFLARLYHDFTPKALANGSLKPSRVHQFEGGLDKVAEILELQGQNKIPGAAKPVLVFTK